MKSKITHNFFFILNWSLVKKDIKNIWHINFLMTHMKKTFIDNIKEDDRIIINIFKLNFTIL